MTRAIEPAGPPSAAGQQPPLSHVGTAPAACTRWSPV